VTRAAIDFAGQPALFELRPVSVRSADFKLFAQLADGSFERVQPDPTTTFRGELIGVPGSKVAATVDETGMTARILLPGGGEHWIEPIARHVPEATLDMHALYTTSAVIPNGGTCDSDLLPKMLDVPMVSGGPSSSVQAATGLSTAELGCDADFQFFNLWGSVANTETRINLVINTMNTQYEEEVGITHVITTTLVRTSASQPYTSTDAVTLLNQFRNEWNANQGGIQRDVAQLFNGKEIDGGTIGIAWLGAVCSSYGYGVVQSDFNNNFSCATDLSAHELGHNWDADHCSCTSNTMNPYITCANTFNSTVTIPEIVSFRDSIGCLDAGDPCDIAADFSADTTSGCAPLAVSFTDLSTGTGTTSWTWDFGDGNGSSSQNPSYSYASAGTYTVSLTAASSTCSDVETKTGYVTVGAVPTADFTADTTSGSAPLSVTFTDQSSGVPTSWSWDFGDGNGSSSQNPSHSYSSAGTYSVTLTASNACGSDVETKLDYITVSDPPAASECGVGDVAVVVVNLGKGQKQGQATITIVDDAGNPVANATVTGDFTREKGNGVELVDQGAMGVTNGSGQAFISSSSLKGGGDWCFEVTSVSHGSLTYNANLNSVTKSCAGGGDQF